MQGWIQDWLMGVATGGYKGSPPGNFLSNRPKKSNFEGSLKQFLYKLCSNITPSKPFFLYKWLDILNIKYC